MSNYTDDFSLHVELSEVEVLADGVLIRKIHACERVVDVDHDRRIFIVLIGDEAAAQQGDSHGLLKPRLHEKERCRMHVAVVGRLGFTFNPEGQCGVVNHGSRAQRHGHGLHTRNGAHLVVEVAQARASFGRGRGGGCR